MVNNLIRCDGTVLIDAEPIQLAWQCPSLFNENGHLLCMTVLHFLFSTSNGEVHYNWDELARDKAVQSVACDVCTMIVWTRFRLIQLLGESAAANCERWLLSGIRHYQKPEVWRRTFWLGQPNVWLSYLLFELQKGHSISSCSPTSAFHFFSKNHIYFHFQCHDPKCKNMLNT